MYRWNKQIGGVQKTKPSKLMHFFFFLIFFLYLASLIFHGVSKVRSFSILYVLYVIGFAIEERDFMNYTSGWGRWVSEPPWAQTFLESWLENQGLKTNIHIEILLIFASFSSQSRRFPVGNFSAGNVEVQWQCQAGLFPPPQGQFYHRLLVPFCAFPISSKMCQKLLANLNPFG